MNQILSRRILCTQWYRQGQTCGYRDVPHVWEPQQTTWLCSYTTGAEALFYGCMLVQRRWMTGCPWILTLGGQISAVGLPECWLMRKRAASRRTALQLSSNRHSSSSEIGGCVVPKQPRAVDTGNLHSRPSRSSVHALAPSRSCSESSKTRYPKEGTIQEPIPAGVSSSSAAGPGLPQPTLPWPRVSTPGPLSGCCRCSSPHPFRLLSECEGELPACRCNLSWSLPPALFFLASFSLL